MKNSVSLRVSLLKTLLGAITLTAILIIASVWNTTNDLVQQNLRKELDANTKLLQNIVEQKTSALAASVRVLSNGYEFKAAFATQDPPTIESALETINNREAFDFFKMVSIDLSIVAAISSESPQQLPLSAFPESSFSPNTTTESFVYHSDKLYFVVIAPIVAPRLIGYLVAGMWIDDPFLDELSYVVNTELVIVKAATSPPVIVSSSVEQPTAQRLVNATKANIDWLSVVTDSSPLYSSKAVNLAGMEGLPVSVLMALDVSEQYYSFFDLQATIIAISIVVILISLAIAMRLSKKVSQPVGDLLNAVNKVAEGDYEQPITVEHQLSEITELAHSFTQMQKRIRSREERISYQAQHDMLTGLFNRNYITNELEKRLSEAQPFQVLGINVVGFRAINDVYGYANGDRCLEVLSERLQRWSGLAARIAGGEILYIPKSKLNTMQLETLKHILEQPVETQEISIPVKVTFSILHCPEDSTTPHDVFRKINIIADESKKSGQWMISFERELEQHYLRRLKIITELKRVLSNDLDELTMVYQPKICIATRRVTGVEALIRWHSQALGFLPPDEFIEIAEQASLIEQLTYWVVGKTLSDLKRFRDKGYVFTVAINLSGQDIQNPALIEHLQKQTQSFGLNASDVELEITESDLVKDAELAYAHLQRLKESGFVLAIDDFGTGYSSLAYLKNLPVNVLKVDKSFVMDLSNDRSDQQIVGTVLNLAKAFNLSVIAEGVEEAGSLELLRKWGCQSAQGYHISRPLPPADLVDWLESSPYIVTRHVE